MPIEYDNYAPHFLWFLNHRFRDDELIRQMHAMKEKGYGGFFMHWLYGGEPYMGEKWLKALDVIVQKSAQMGLKAWLYDEGWCPSGFAGGRVLAINPELSAQTIWHKKFALSAGEELCYDFDLMTPLGVVAVPIEAGVPQHDKLLRLDAELGTVMGGRGIPYEHDWGYYPHAQMRLHWRVKASGSNQWRLRWKAPKGSWRVFIICSRNRFVWDKLNRVDALNPEATSFFLRQTHEVYAERYSQYFGKTIPGIMTDEPKYLPLAWTDSLPEIYRSQYGTDLVKKLPLLFDDTFPDAGVFRARFYKLLGDLFFRNFITPVADWCEDNGLILTGHISPEEDPSHECDLIGSLGRDLSRFGIPGTDLIIQAVGNRKRPALNLGPRVASSVAHQQGMKRVFVEVGACCKEDLSLEELKHMCDWLIINGVNMMTFHGLAYSLEKERKFLTDQNFSVDNNLWSRSEILVDYLKNTCSIVSEYRPDPRVAILKPQTSIRFQTLVDEETLGFKDEEREQVDENLIAVVQHLLENHIDFDIIDEDLSDSWIFREDKLQVGCAMYEAVVIPGCVVVSREAAEKLGTIGPGIICQNHKPRILPNDQAVTWQETVHVCRLERIARTIRDQMPSLPVLVGQKADEVYLYHGFNGAGRERFLMLNLLGEENPVALSAVHVQFECQLAPFECRIINPARPQSRTDSTERTEISVSKWQVSAGNENHVPIRKSPCRITVQQGAQIRGLILERGELPEFVETLRIDGAKPDFVNLADYRFYTRENILLSIGNMLTAGEHIIEFHEGDAFLTLLLAGRFSVNELVQDNLIIGPERTETSHVSRFDAGYPYLRGEVCFEAEFALQRDLVEGAKLVLPGRKGVVTAVLDGREIGTIGWCPNEVEVGRLKAGKHHLELKVQGEGIGILRHPASEAGLRSGPYFLGSFLK